MNISKNINKKVNILFYICLISILTLAAGSSFAMLITIPILLASIGLDKGVKDFFIVFLGSYLVSLIFKDIKPVTLFYIPMLALSLIEIGLIKSKLSDKKQIIINFILTSIIFIGIYKYQMLAEGITISDMASELKEVLEPSMEYNIPDSIYERSFALYPSILSAFAMIYTLFSLKIIRNYLAYKNKAVDIKNLNELRLSKGNFVVIIACAIVLYFLLNTILNVPSLYITTNLFAIIILVLILNGILTYDYLTMAKRGIISRGMRWFFIIIFFYFFMIIFLTLGLADVFVNFRSKTRRIDAK